MATIYKSTNGGRQIILLHTKDTIEQTFDNLCKTAEHYIGKYTQVGEHTIQIRYGAGVVTTYEVVE